MEMGSALPEGEKRLPNVEATAETNNQTYLPGAIKPTSSAYLTILARVSKLSFLEILPRYVSMLFTANKKLLRNFFIRITISNVFQYFKFTITQMSFSIVLRMFWAAIHFQRQF